MMPFLFSKRQDPAACDAQTTETFGVLTGIRHASSGGSMAYRSEFEIELTPQEIVRCAYWPQDPDQKMVQKEHIPVSVAQWTEISETVQTLWPLFHEVNPEPLVHLTPKIQVLDGGDYSRWYLTRQTEDGIRTAQYSQPDDRRIRTLIALLQELAEPIGREIPRYAPPVLCGIFFQNEKERCSYQCTPWSDGEDVYRFIVNDHPKNSRRSLYERIPSSVWDAVAAFTEPLHAERFPTAGSGDRVFCTLYYSDGKQKRVVPDKRTVEKLQSYFAGLTDRIQSEILQKRGE